MNCDENKIYNPASKRCVSISGKIGKQLINADTKTPIVVQKICDKDKIYNPKSKRCVSISGKIGKQLALELHKKEKEQPQTIKSTKEKNQKKKFPLIGQTKETPEENDPLRKFYASLLKQKPTSEMAIKWCTEHGLLPNQKEHPIV